MASNHGERFGELLKARPCNLLKYKYEYEYIAIPKSKRASLHIEFSLTCVRKGIRANMIMMPDSLVTSGMGMKKSAH